MPVQVPDFSLETQFIHRGIWPIAGVDEAGRGPLAGPLAVAAVILDPEDVPDGLNDSKRLTASQRQDLYWLIMSRALTVAVALSPADEIDALNIRQATLVSMRRAVRALALRPAHVLIDGCDTPVGLDIPADAIVAGDCLSATIAAASIVAKVTRDRLMTRLDAHCPGYGFAQHAGYATAVHREAIAVRGRSFFHRLSFRCRLPA